MSDDPQTKSYQLDIHLRVLAWFVEHHDEWDFKHAQANMDPYEFDRYRKRTLKEAVRFLVNMAKQ